MNTKNYKTKCESLSFDLKTDESILDFFERKTIQIGADDDVENLVSERMVKLFDEFIGIKKNVSKEERLQVVKVFMLGYGNGWNDRKELEDQK